MKNVQGRSAKSTVIGRQEGIKKERKRARTRREEDRERRAIISFLIMLSGTKLMSLCVLCVWVTVGYSVAENKHATVLLQSSCVIVSSVKAPIMKARRDNNAKRERINAPRQSLASLCVSKKRCALMRTANASSEGQLSAKVGVIMQKEIDYQCKETSIVLCIMLFDYTLDTATSNVAIRIFRGRRRQELVHALKKRQKYLNIYPWDVRLIYRNKHDVPGIEKL